MQMFALIIVINEEVKFGVIMHLLKQFEIEDFFLEIKSGKEEIVLDFSVGPILVTLHLHGRHHFRMLIFDFVYEEVDGETKGLSESLMIVFECSLELLDVLEIMLYLFQREILVLVSKEEFIAVL